MAVIYPHWAGGVFLALQPAWSSVSLKSVVHKTFCSKG